MCDLPANTTCPKLSKPARPASYKAENAKAGKRGPYGHRVTELCFFSEIQEAASAIAIGVKDLQNIATYAIQ